MKTSIIFNPSAGTRDMQRQLKQAGQYLEKQGWRINWCQTHHAGHATTLAKEAVEQGQDVVIAAGGDGTINEVVNGLVGSNTALAILPAGTGNVFAADMNLPLPTPLAPQALTKAAKAIVGGQMRSIDVAKTTFADGRTRHFILWAGVGLDAAITHTFDKEKTERRVMRMLGFLAWFVAGFVVLRDFRGVRMQISFNNEFIDRRVILMTVNNSQLYGRFWRLSPEAKMDDGLLDVVIMEGYSTWSAIKHITLAALGKHLQNPRVELYQTKQIKVETLEPKPIHLDAESVGFTPIDIEIVPQALKFIAPQKAPADHFVKQINN